MSVKRLQGMQRLVFRLILAVFVISAIALPTLSQSSPTPVTQNQKPARIIFFHIDGLHYQAPERLKMTNYLSLQQQGTSVREAYILIPWHQTENGYRILSLTSPPNPTTMAGSIFLAPW